MLAEFLEPIAAGFRKEKIRDTIVFFGSAPRSVQRLEGD